MSDPVDRDAPTPRLSVSLPRGPTLADHARELHTRLVAGHDRLVSEALPYEKDYTKLDPVKSKRLREQARQAMAMAREARDLEDKFAKWLEQKPDQDERTSQWTKLLDLRERATELGL